MSTVIVFIVLACLASEASAGLLARLTGSTDKTVDFDALDRWLVKRLPGVENEKANIYFVSNHLDELRDNPSARKAGELFVNITGNNDCDQHLLSNLKDAHQDEVSFAGKRRIEKLMASKFSQLDASCGKYVEETVGDLYDKSLKKDIRLDQFLKVVVLRPNQWAHPATSDPSDGHPRQHFIFCTANGARACELSPKDWAGHLIDLAKEDEKERAAWSGKTRMPGNRRDFDHAYWKYLEEPCRLLSQTLAQTFEGLYGLAGLQSSSSVDYKSFMMKRTPIVQRLSYGYRVCKTLKGVDKTRVFAEVN